MARALASTDHHPDPAGKPNFASRASAFANRVRLLPVLPIYVSACCAAILFVTAAGAFGTGAMSLGLRLAFWTLLIGFNGLAWVSWLAWRVRSNRDWWPAVGLGIVILNLPIPLEIGVALQVVGGGQASGWVQLWVRAGAVSAAVLLVLVAVLRSRSPAPERPDFAKSRLWREGFPDAAAVAALSSEDHYCRIWRHDGTSSLIHARFADLLREVDDADGALLRRGQWVAADAVSGIDRDARKWQVRLRDGRRIAVSPSAASELRAKGWIAGGAGQRPGLKEGA